ncbi:MAG: sulfatase-like hydrolase/transferase [Myxococcota bacterium]
MRCWYWLLLLLLGTACEKPRPNILLVTFDTTRWDHVGFSGGKPGVTPMLDALAQRGTVFAQTLTTQPLTVPAHTSILTGLYPYHHGVRNNGTYRVPESVTTLPERLAPLGYQTHAIVSAFVLDSQFGLDQGFEGYDDDLSPGPRQKMFMFRELRAEQTAAKGALWLRSQWKREQPFMMWMHFFDPHADYEPPVDVAAQFPGDLYSGELHYADRELGRVFQELEALNALDNTLVIFTSDHGDSLGEHGERTHGLFIYDATMRVPLLMAGPGVPAGYTVDTLSRTIDIVPTVLDLLSLPVDPTLDGRSLKALWEGSSFWSRSTEAPRTAYLETFVPLHNFGWAELRGLRSAEHKAIDAPRPEFYRLEPDPGERINRFEPGSELTGEREPLFRKLAELKTQDPIYAGEQQAATLDAETRRRLSALGYVWDDGAPDAHSGPRQDPKDRIQFWDEFQRGQDLMRLKKYSEAAQSIQALLQADPNNVVAKSSLASALVAMGRDDEALALFQQLQSADAKRETAFLGAARLHTKRRQFVEAEALIQHVITVQPENPEGYTSLGDLYLEQGRNADAERAFRKALAIDPHSSLAAAGLGNGLNRAGKTREAAEVLRVALAREPSSHALTYNLAVVLERLGDQEQALQLYQQALKLEPDHSMSWNNLGSLLDRQGKREEALKRIAHAHALDPNNLEATFNLGALLVATGKAQEGLPLLEQVMQTQPSLVRALTLRVRALEQLGRVEEARALLRQRAQQEPGAWLLLTHLELNQGNALAARAALQSGLQVGGEPMARAVKSDPKLSSLLK